jgi:hypothetical protein
VAVSLLSKRGYTVAASTGKPEAHDYLRQLGASEILRGIKVLGVDTPSTPLEVRHELWEEVTRERALLSSVDSIVSEATLEDIPRVTRAMLDGQTRGRVLVRPSDE